MSDFAALNSLRKAERDLTKANAELASKNKQLEDELAAALRDHANARAWILQMQAERSELLPAAADFLKYFERVSLIEVSGDLAVSLTALRAAVAKSTGEVKA